VTLPTGTSRSDCNVLEAFSGGGERLLRTARGQYDLAAWRARNDRQSGGAALEVSLDPERLELRVTAPTGVGTPDLRPFALSPGIPPLKELLPADFPWRWTRSWASEYAPLSVPPASRSPRRARNPARSRWAVVGLAWDGSPVRVDPGGVGPGRAVARSCPSRTAPVREPGVARPMHVSRAVVDAQLSVASSCSGATGKTTLGVSPTHSSSSVGARM